MAAEQEDPIIAWRGIVTLVHARVRGRSEAELDHRPVANVMTLRETVHHVAEANVVAAAIVTAALGSPGCTFDWSWMLPFGPWWENMRYEQKPVGPALGVLKALNEYLVAQVEPLDDGLQRTVRLIEEPGGKPKTVTVGHLLLQEAGHARQHFAELPE